MMQGNGQMTILKSAGLCHRLRPATRQSPPLRDGPLWGHSPPKWSPQRPLRLPILLWPHMLVASKSHVFTEWRKARVQSG